MILYSLISRGTLPIVQFNSSERELESVVKVVLQRAAKSNKKYMSFEKSDLFYTCYIDNDFVFLAVYDSSAWVDIVIRFLTELADIFYTSKESANTDLESGGKSNNARLTLKMKNLMSELNDNPEKFDKVKQMSQNIDEVTKLANESVENFIDRNFKIDTVIESSSLLKKNV